MDDDSIQKQIEAKKKRLEELKQKRLQRQQKQDDGSASTTSSSPSISTSSQPQQPYASSPTPSPRPTLTSSQSLQQLQPSTDDLLDVVNSLITTAQPPPPAQAATAQPIAQPAQSAPTRPKLSLAPQPTVTVAPIDTIVYEIATQTNESYLVQMENEKDKEADKAANQQPHSPSKQHIRKAGKGRTAASSADSDDESEEVRKERDILRQRETELMTTIKQLKSQLEQLTSQQQSQQGATALLTLSPTEG